MAILTEVPGLKVVVVTDDENSKLKEYTDEDEELILIEGAKKTVKDTVECVLKFDGRSVTSRVITAADRRRKAFTSLCTELVYENDGYYARPFLFTELPISEEADAGDSVRDPGRLGTISLLFRRCLKGNWKTKRQRHGSVGFEPIAEIAETQLKGLSVCHQIKLGAGRKIDYTPMTCSVDYPYGRKPFATFEFRYRDIRTLQSLGLTPDKPATPVVAFTTAVAVKRVPRFPSIHSNAERLDEHMVRERPEGVPQGDSTSSMTTVNVKVEGTSIPRPPSIEPPVEQLNREELEAIARKYRARSPTVPRGIKRERSEINVYEGAATRNAQKFKTSFNAEVGAEVIDLDSD